VGAIKVKLVASLEGRTPAQRGTITGLGLKKFGSVKVLKDTPAIRGMVAKVQHMVTVENVAGEAPKRKRTTLAKKSDGQKAAAAK